MGECHYLEGNHKAKARAQVIRLVLQDIGVEPERFTIEWVSSAEAPRFAEVVTKFTEKITQMGPTILRKKAAAAN